MIPLIRKKQVGEISSPLHIPPNYVDKKTHTSHFKANSGYKKFKCWRRPQWENYFADLLEKMTQPLREDYPNNLAAFWAS